MWFSSPFFFRHWARFQNDGSDMERRQIFPRRGNLGARTAEPLAARRNARTARQSSRVHRTALLTPHPQSSTRPLALSPWRLQDASLESMPGRRWVFVGFWLQIHRSAAWSSWLPAHDVLPPARATARSIRQHLRCEQAPRNAPRPHCPAAAMPPQMQGQRNAASTG